MAQQQRPTVNLACCGIPLAIIGLGVYIFSSGGFGIRTVCHFVGYVIAGMGVLIAQAGYAERSGVDPHGRRQGVSRRFMISGIVVAAVGVLIVNLPGLSR